MTTFNFIQKKNGRILKINVFIYGSKVWVARYPMLATACPQQHAVAPKVFNDIKFRLPSHGRGAPSDP